MIKKIAVANQKGGIGKTTTATTLAAGLENRGFHTLYIDCDPQRNSTGFYEAETEDTETLADVLFGNISAKEAVQHTIHGDIIASDIQLYQADTLIPADADRFYRLGDALKPLENEYDYFIFDTPPSNGALLGNVLCYADEVIMPTTADSFGVQGMLDFYNSMGTYSKRINPLIHIAGILIIKYKGRQNMTKQIEDELLPQLASEMKTKLYHTKIRESVRIPESQACRQDIFKYDKNSTTAIDYNLFIEEYLKEK